MTSLQGLPLNKIEFPLRAEHIALDALLKITGLVSSGGLAKIRVQQGEVRVDGQIELRRSCKLRAGQVVCLDTTCVQIV
jgi:ribosome-associated protein